MKVSRGFQKILPLHHLSHCCKTAMSIYKQGLKCVRSPPPYLFTMKFHLSCAAFIFK
ncbi:hypothetical protein E1A91_D05G148100v1 [Gossypium mustelinum]|uniref:Uncharacterized protein n=1 Tax=Gossypium mustelinum TaxID=34275 RepID=A0A5D2UV45_GOSMU|nr:hypothetical protein E1A91_D05G148100v1 [Gossypium mustelinum]